MANTIRWWVGPGLLLAGCGGSGGTSPSPPPPAPVASVTVSPAADTVVVGGSLTLTALARDSNGTVLTGRAVTWTVDDPSLGSVVSGRLTASAIGVEKVIATVESRSDTAIITLAPVVTVGRRMPSLFAGDTTLLAASYTDLRGNPLAGPAADWSTGDPTVATVAPGGIVSGHNPGRAVIAASWGGSADSQVVIVLAPRLAANREVTFVHDTTTPTALSFLELWAANPGGGGNHRLSGNDFDVQYYRWAPDGSRLVITGGPKIGLSGTSDLYTMNADGSGLQKIGSLAYLPQWSPDGTRFTYVDGGTGDVGVMNADGSAAGPLPTGSGTDTDPAWSPDGRLIAWRKDNGTLSSETGLWIMEADGSHQRKLTVPTGPTYPVFHWAPDGKQLAVESQGGIWLINVDGSGLHPLSPNCTQAGCTAPTYKSVDWSPDGSHLAFAGDDGTGSLDIIGRDGVGFITIPIADPTPSSTPRWSPDGQLVLFEPYDVNDTTDPFPRTWATSSADGQTVTIIPFTLRVGAGFWRP